MKVFTHTLTTNITDDINVSYNKIFSVQPLTVTEKIMNLEYYNGLNWCSYKRKENKQNGHAKSVKRILKLLEKLFNLHQENKNDKNDKYEFRINFFASDLKKIFNDEYKIYLQILERMELITRCQKSKYKPTAFAYTYIVSPSLFYSFDYSMIFIDDKKYDLNQPLKVEYTYYDAVVSKNIDKRMINTLDVVKLNKSDAIIDEIKNYDYSQSIEKLAYRINSIINFGSKKYLTIGKKVNRLYHHITNLSGIARKHLNIKFNFVDITNCQPLLLAYTMKSNNYEVDENYINDVESGSFYEQFMLLHKDRNQTKVAIYKNLFFGFNVNDETNKLFKKLYPNVWGYLNEVNKNKENSGQTLASILQNIETEIFSDIAEVCENSGYLFTLHDSIYFDNEKDEQPVKNHLTKKFAEFGLQVKFNFD